MSPLRLGNAPVSYGVYGEEAGGDGVSPPELPATMAATGYAGCELGPPGFFGSPEETADVFARHGLAAAGGYAPVRFALGDDAVAHDLERVAVTCRELAAVAERTGDPGVLVLADEGSDVLLRNPARAWDDRSLALDDAGWARLVRHTATVLRMATAYGLRVAFHPHISTYVESPWEVDRLLECTGVGLTLDTGHLRLAGAEPAACWKRWRERILHLHLKDVSLRVLDAAKRARRTDFDTWWSGVCVPFGEGDVDLDGFLDAVLTGPDRYGRYDGWLVVEQDRGPTPAEEYADVAREQAANHAWLAHAVQARTLGIRTPHSRTTGARS